MVRVGIHKLYRDIRVIDMGDPDIEGVVDLL